MSTARDLADFLGSSNVVTDAHIVGMTSSKLSGNLPALNASALTNLDSADLTGTINTARLPATIQTTTVEITTVDLGDWTVTEAGGELKFSHSGTVKAKMDSSGNLTTVGNITAYGTM